MRILRCLLFIVCLINTTHVDGQWCCLDSTLQILDKSTVSLRLIISGASNNSLASPLQGLCGVKIKFDHKFIGDVTMDLISPSGQKVRLIGPTGNSGNSSFSKWFVSFVRCSAIAVPDPGFKKKWDNIQSWGILGKFYSGTYYPQNGCLEDFNLGTVNGTWTLSISDAEKFYEGKIESFCLLFCDQTGINCKDCSPNGGLFTNTSLDYCLGDPNLAAIEEVSFPVFTPDTDYVYKYIISQNDQILEIKDKADLSLYPVGDYDVCGVSYYKSDSVKLPDVGQRISDFKNDLVLNLIGFCAELSKNCLQLSIHQGYNGIIQNVTLCKGDSILIGNKFYNQSGKYTILLSSTFGCDSNIVLNLDVIDLKVLIGSIDTLDCKKNTISIDISSSIKSSTTSIVWSTVNGNFSDLTNLLIVKIDKAGDYKVVLTDGSCSDSTEFKVDKKNDIPELLITGDTISCFKKSVNVVGRTNALNPIFKWSDGTNDLGSDSLIQVSNPGLYYVTITDQNGCSNFDVIDVKSDTIKPQLFLNAGEISCRDSFAPLNFTANLKIINLVWDGPNQFMSIVDSLSVSNPGQYTLTVEAENGCITTSSIDVKSNKSVPDFFVVPDTLNCRNNKMIILNARTNSFLDSITYSGPSGFFSHDLMPAITEAGVYQIKLVDTAGCVLDTSIVIGLDTSTVRFQVSSSILDCINNSVQLVLKYLSVDTINSILWTGPPGFNSTLKSPFTNEAGLYTVMVTSLNGCTAQDTITVLQDSKKPNIMLQADSLDCNTSQVKIDATVSNVIVYKWSGPNNFNSFKEDPVVSDSGVYKLIVTALNGCTSEKTIEILEDRRSPINSIVSGVFNCKTDSVELKLIKNGLVDSIQWQGPGNFVSNSDSFYVYKAGVYKVFAKGKNGCVDSSLIDIDFDTVAPIINLVADTLSCNKPVANIKLNSLDTGLFYLWHNPSGDTIQSKNIIVSIPGWYKILVTSQNGCTQLDSIELIDRRNNPDFQFIRDSIICSDSIAELGILSNDLNLNYQWSGPGGFNSSDSSIQIIIPGWYYYSISNSFGCSVNDSFLVKAYLQKPKVLFSNPVFDCLNKTNPLLIATLVDSLELFEWILPSGLTEPNKTILANNSGKYIFRGENEFGCGLSDSLNVSFDTLAPVITDVFLDSITCSRKQVVPLVETIPAGMDYSWKGPGNFSSQLPNPILTLTGDYTLRITAANFCIIDTIITLVADTSAPIIHPIGGEITCGNVNVKLDIQSNDSLSSVIWQSSSGTLFNQRAPSVIDTGWYIVIVKGQNDCLSFDSAYVGLNNQPPIVNAKSASIPCSPDSAQIHATSTDTAAIFLWRGLNGYVSNTANPFVKDTGVYILTVIGRNACKTIDSINVDYNRILPKLNAIGGFISCKDTSVQLTAITDSLTIHFNWKGPGLNDSIVLNPFVSLPGFYVISIVNSLGCLKDTTVEVAIDTSKPVLQIQAIDSLICEQKDVRLTNLINCANCNFQWSTMDGMIISNQNKDSVLVDGGGTYTLKLENKLNGCFQIQSYNLVEISSSLNGLNLQIISPSCFGVNDGEILFDSVIGGVPPYLISFDGKKFEQINDLKNQVSGLYNLYIKDKYGCIYDTLFNINQPLQITLSVGRDTSIRLGQSYPIFPSTNADTSLLRLISWDPAKELNCSNCFDVNASPTSNTRYVLEIMDENGCVAVDDILISIIDKPNIYIPNAFSPNHDQVNDFLTLVSGGDEVKILTFQIFDRWGNLVFSKENFNVLDRLDLWDGTFKGEMMNPGVYVYKMEVLLLNGNTLIQAGDFTLIR